MQITVWIGLGVVGLGLGLSLWTIIPAPTMTLFPLTVIVPEMGTLLALVNGAIAIISLKLFSSDWIELVAVGCSMVALVLSIWPLFQLSRTIRQIDRRMKAGLGIDYNDYILPTQQTRMRPRPFSLLDLIRGVSVTTKADQSAKAGWHRPNPDRQFIPTTNGAPLVVDLYPPPQPSDLTASNPTLVAIYGGAWQSGKPEDNTNFCAYMAAQGYVVAAISYRHAPDYHFPAQLEDIQTALQWLVTQANQYGIDSTRIALVGWSAGAHLAMLAAYQPNAVPVRGVVNYYGPVDLTQGYRDRPKPDPINVRTVLETFLGGSPDECPDLYQAASPIHQIRPGLPPTLSIYGDRDHIVKPIFGQLLDQQLQATTNISILIRLPWAEHAFDRVWQGMGNQIAVYYVERFLAWALRTT